MRQEMHCKTTMHGGYFDVSKRPQKWVSASRACARIFLMWGFLKLGGNFKKRAPIPKKRAVIFKKRVVIFRKRLDVF